MDPQGFPAFEAMQKWVEKGVAPDTIIFGQREPGSAKGQGKIYRTRPVCAYPKIAHYKGNGDPNDAGSFACVAPPK